MNQSQFFDLIQNLGIAGGPVMAVLWWLERTERQAAQKELRDLLVQVLTTTAQTANAMSEVKNAVAGVGATAQDTHFTLAQVAQLVRSFSYLLKKRVG